MLMMNEATLGGAVVSADRLATVFDDNCRSIMPKAWSLIRRRLFIAEGREDRSIASTSPTVTNSRGRDRLCFDLRPMAKPRYGMPTISISPTAWPFLRTVAFSDVVEKFDR
jgi:hypothetical protein